MTATITSPPACRLVSLPCRSPLERALLLAWMASEETENPGGIPRPVAALVLAANAAQTLTGAAMDEAWAEYLDAVRLERDTGDGIVTWQELTDESAPDGRHEDACDIARSNAASALSVLVGGAQ